MQIVVIRKFLEFLIGLQVTRVIYRQMEFFSEFLVDEVGSDPCDVAAGRGELYCPVHVHGQLLSRLASSYRRLQNRRDQFQLHLSTPFVAPHISSARGEVAASGVACAQMHVLLHLCTKPDDDVADSYASHVPSDG